jgi:hypothetical protein
MVVDSSSYISFSFAVIVTVLCIALGYIAVLRRELRELRGEKSQFEWNGTLSKVLDLLKNAKDRMQSKKATKGHAECVEEEKVTDDKSVVETPQERYERYSQRTMDEVSGPELWQLWHHGTPSVTGAPADQRRYADGHIEHMMKDTNDILRRRVRRLEQEYDAASEANDIDEMHKLELLISECGALYMAAVGEECKSVW